MKTSVCAAPLPCANPRKRGPLLAVAYQPIGVVPLCNVDILDGTPVLDIKPYVPAFDVWEAERIGWFTGKVDAAGTCKADERFR